MTLDDYNACCSALPHTSHVVQWGGSHVWKVGGKMFAVASFGQGAVRPAVTFKVTPIAFEVLRDTPGCRPAPYLASRGMSWIQRVTATGLDDAALEDCLAQSHDLVSSSLPKRVRLELGLLPPSGSPRPVRPNPAAARIGDAVTAGRPEPYRRARTRAPR